MARPTKALISSEAILHNYNLANKLTTNSKNIVIVKANAYGHDIKIVSKILAFKAPVFAVSSLEEAMIIRGIGIDTPILLLEGCFSQSELITASNYNIWVMLCSNHQVEWIIKTKLPRPIKVCLKVDTGMHRLGFLAYEVVNIIKKLKNTKNIQRGIIVASHFSSSDICNSETAKEQLKTFMNLKNELNQKHSDYFNIEYSLANSSAILNIKESHYEWNRIGYMLYGNSPLVSNKYSSRLKPVMTLQSAIISTREIDVGESVGYNSKWTAKRKTRIATVAIGYGDGYPRSAKSGTPTLVKGKIASIIGAVSMDMITIDVTDIKEAKINDVVTLWGSNLSVNTIARYSNTIGYDLLTRVSSRVPRFIKE